jgi:tetratricopeptide (TPR) repeat protein
MRSIVLLLIGVAMLTVMAVALPCDEQLPSATAMQAMKVAELEKSGDACRSQKNYEQATAYFTEALRKDSKNAKVYNKRGLAELSNSQFEAAHADFLKATKYNRNFPEAWNDLGVVSYVDKNYPAAVKCFSKAIALDELRPNFHVNLGLTYFAQDQMDLAMRQYSRALEIDPDALLHSSNAGMSAQITDRDQRAKQDFMMARVYAKLGQVDNCLVCLEKAKDNGYTGLTDVYKEDDFSSVRKDARLASIVPPPAPSK